MMSVLDLSNHNSLPNFGSEFEVRVGIDRVSPSTSHSKSIVYGIADYLTINELRRLSTLIRTYLFVSVLARLKRSVLALLLALFGEANSLAGERPSGANPSSRMLSMMIGKRSCFAFVEKLADETDCIRLNICV
jgi:hypothetical protein